MKSYFADSFLLGVCDPSLGKNIPHGTVAIPGLPEYVESLLVSRCPCQYKDDMLHLPVLRKKPSDMTTEDWNLLRSRHFGEICF